LVIGFLPCTNVPGGCTGPEQLGSILYNGPYNPQVLEPGKSYENLTVTIPTGIPTGAAQIAIARFFLIGVSQVGFEKILLLNALPLLQILGWAFAFSWTVQCDCDGSIKRGFGKTVRPIMAIFVLRGVDYWRWVTNKPVLSGTTCYLVSAVENKLCRVHSMY